MDQFANLPAPLPIRIPFGFLESGKWGKTETQNARLVISDFRDDRFRNSFSRKIFLAEIRRGRSIAKPVVP